MFFWEVLSRPIAGLEIEANCRRIKAGEFRCELTISVPEGWKLPKAPDISTLSNKNLKIESDGKLERINGATYKANFLIKAENGDVPDRAELSVDCFACGDICSVVSKKIWIKLGESQISKTFVLLLAFLGGLILNVMPCVLPVIIMKLRTLSSKEALLGSIFGNYASFGAFAACLAFLKIAGETVGWGAHFQNPYFLEAATLTLFGLTLYSFELIQFFPSINVSGEKRAFFGSFTSSVVASVIAIPCTAPFLGTAAAFAIQGSVGDLFAAFFAIATGFCAPYFLSFLIPAEFLLKFKNCGGILKRIVDCGALIAFLWLFRLLSNYLSATATALYALSFATLAALLKKDRRKLALAFLALCFCGRIFTDFSTKPVDSCKELALLESKLSEKRTVVFNITADWCLTCKYNRIRALDNPKVADYIKKNDVEFIEANMTKKSDALMKFIDNRGRAGIPFTVVYGQNAPEGILLDEILTPDEIIKALEKAK
ncbi:MAG: thioredoxin family protein [Holosporaceae bacterium]|nr:thioredoxin family protein [Holosporaceae bacterium]